jgi:hypothetical protein
MRNMMLSRLLAVCAFCALAFGQDTTAVLEGQVNDPSGGAIARAAIEAVNPMNGYSRKQSAATDGAYRLILPAGVYNVSVTAPGFAPYTMRALSVSVNQNVRLDIRLQIAKEQETINVVAEAPLVETSMAAGNVVNGQQLVDLPLNGRNFTQLGLLQPGVAGMTQGVMIAGGSLRAGQAYAVNGQRPESNNYLVDGAVNVNRVDGGYAVKTPIDAIQEFRIITGTAPAEFGGTAGATTTVISRSGGNALHGSLYEFFRNDALDARNFFSRDVEPLKQNQFGATAGGRIRPNRDFLFGYYEGFRNREGVTRSATVPSDTQRTGDFSGLTDPQTGQPVPLINYFSGQPFPDNRIPAQAMDPLAVKLLSFYPHANAGANLFVTTQTLSNNTDQGGLRFDHIFGPRDQFFAHYTRASAANVDPLSIAGANVPGFPVGEDINTHMATVSETHTFGPATVNSARAAFFRNVFETDKPLNRTSPAELGFGYNSTLASRPPISHRERVCQRGRSHNRSAQYGAEYVGVLRFSLE